MHLSIDVMSSKIDMDNYVRILESIIYRKNISPSVAFDQLYQQNIFVIIPLIQNTCLTTLIRMYDHGIILHEYDMIISTILFTNNIKCLDLIVQYGFNLNNLVHMLDGYFILDWNVQDETITYLLTNGDQNFVQQVLCSAICSSTNYVIKLILDIVYTLVDGNIFSEICLNAFMNSTRYLKIQNIIDSIDLGFNIGPHLNEIILSLMSKNNLSVAKSMILDFKVDVKNLIFLLE